MLWAKVRRGSSYRLLSVALATLLITSLMGPGIAAFAEETTATPVPAPEAAPAPEDAPAPEVAPEPASPEVVVPEEPAPAQSEASAPVEEAAVPDAEVIEPAASEPVRSQEAGPATAIPALSIGDNGNDNGGGPRDDFPDPIVVGEGCELVTIATFWAGQNTDVGTVSATNDAENLYVTFETTGGWVMGVTHLYVGLVPPDEPFAPGQFPYQTTHDPMVTSYTYTIPLADIGAGPGDVIYIAAHAEVHNDEQSETAWAGVGQWPGLLFTHTVQECVEPELPDLTVIKFHDLNENGDFDEGEPLLEGFTFEVSMGEFLASLMSDENGEALFVDLEPGVYEIDEVDLPEGWFATGDLPIVIELAEGQDATVYVGNAVVEVEPPGIIDLAIEKLADGEVFEPGDDVTYTLTYQNLGGEPAEDFTIVDDYDETYLTVVDSAGGVVADGTITWTIAGPLSVEDGEQTITYVMKVLDDMPDGTTVIDNIVVISHPDDDNLTNNEDDESIEVDNPFAPFTPGEDDDEDVDEEEDEEFLPFTGGEGGFLAVLIALSAAIGMGLRFAGERRS